MKFKCRGAEEGGPNEPQKNNMGGITLMLMF